MALGVFFRKFLCESVFSSNLQLTSNEFSKISPHYISPSKITKSSIFEYKNLKKDFSCCLWPRISNI